MTAFNLFTTQSVDPFTTYESIIFPGRPHLTKYAGACLQRGRLVHLADFMLTTFGFLPLCPNSQTPPFQPGARGNLERGWSKSIVLNNPLHDTSASIAEYHLIERTTLNQIMHILVAIQFFKVCFCVTARFIFHIFDLILTRTHFLRRKSPNNKILAVSRFLWT